MPLNRLTFSFIISSILSFSQSFSSSKKILLKKIYYDHKTTFYCQNPYEIKRVKGKQKALITKDENKYTPRNEYTKRGNINKRAKRLEWEHIVPTWNFGRQFSC